MDAAGKNRYELLFMDDDGEAPVKPKIAAPSENINKKKQAAASGGAATNNTAANKKSNTPAGNKKSNAEKENKSQALNKSDGGHVQNQKKSTKDGATGEGNNNVRNRQTGENRKNAAVGSNSGGGGSGNKPRYNNQSNDNNNRSVTFRNQNSNENAENREQRNNRRNFRDNADNMAANNDQRPPRQYNNYNRDRENRGPTRKREFDRQSGSDKTGVKAIDKRDGAGAHNWGSVKQEIDDINKSNSNTNSNANADADATLTDKEESGNDQSNEQVPANEEEEAAKEMTLDEWKALREQRSKPQYNIRKAGEGEDTSQWKKMTVLNKKKEGDSEEEFEYDPSLYPQRVGRLQRIVDIQFKFNDDRRSGNSGFGRNRGGPGGGRGPRTGGNYENRTRFDDGNSRANGQRRNYGDRNSRNAASHVPKVDDERQFPTLG